MTYTRALVDAFLTSPVVTWIWYGIPRWLKKTLLISILAVNSLLCYQRPYPIWGKSMYKYKYGPLQALVCNFNIMTLKSKLIVCHLSSTSTCTWHNVHLVHSPLSVTMSPSLPSALISSREIWPSSSLLENHRLHGKSTASPVLGSSTVTWEASQKNNKTITLDYEKHIRGHWSKPVYNKTNKVSFSFSKQLALFKNQPGPSPLLSCPILILVSRPRYVPHITLKESFLENSRNI